MRNHSPFLLQIIKQKNMSYKKRKDPSGGLTKLSKFERQQSLWTKETKYGDIVQSIGGPVSSVEDVIRTFEHYKTTQQIEFEDGVKEQMITDYLLDSSNKQHLVFHCRRISCGYEWSGQFISDEQVREMTPSKQLFQEMNN
jgi:hypothetical protein